MQKVTIRQLEYLNQYQTKQTLRGKKKSTSGKKGHNDKMANTSQRFNNQKSIYTKQNSSQNTKTKIAELKEELDNSTIIVEDFNIPLSIIHGKTRQIISKDTENLNNTIKI